MQGQHTMLKMEYQGTRSRRCKVSNSVKQTRASITHVPSQTSILSQIHHDRISTIKPSASSKPANRTTKFTYSVQQLRPQPALAPRQRQCSPEGTTRTANPSRCYRGYLFSCVQPVTSPAGRHQKGVAVMAESQASYAKSAVRAQVSPHTQYNLFGDDFSSPPPLLQNWRSGIQIQVVHVSFDPKDFDLKTILGPIWSVSPLVRQCYKATLQKCTPEGFRLYHSIISDPPLEYLILITYAMPIDP